MNMVERKDDTSSFYGNVKGVGWVYDFGWTK
jgi:hypothetical protein